MVLITDSKQISGYDEQDLEEIAETPGKLGKEKKKHDIHICGDCGSTDFQINDKTKEATCRSCGLVRDFIGDKIDPGQEWREFTQEEKDARSRTGLPLTYRSPDKGLSTVIDWKDVDSSGNKLSPKRRAEMYRLRRWQIRSRFHSSGERNLGIAMPELERLGSQMGIPVQTRENAARLYRKILEKKLVRGRSIEGVVAATLYLECRRDGNPIPIEKFAEYSREDRKSIGAGVRLIQRHLDLKIPFSRPEDYVRRFSSQLELNGETQMKVFEILERVREEGMTIGRDPKGLAAAAMYIGSILTDNKRTQREIGIVADVTEVTVRNRYKEIAKKLGIETGEDHPFPSKKQKTIDLQQRIPDEELPEKLRNPPEIGISRREVFEVASSLCDKIDFPFPVKNTALWICNMIGDGHTTDDEYYVPAVAYLSGDVCLKYGIVTGKITQAAVAEAADKNPATVGSRYRQIRSELGGYKALSMRLDLERVLERPQESI